MKKHRKACHFARKGRRTEGREQGRRVPLELVELEDSSFHLLVKVEADGVRGEMIIDTGASVTVLDRELFAGKAVGEEEGEVASGSVTGQINGVRLIELDSLRIGGRRWRHVRMVGMDLGYVNDVYGKHLSRRVIGLLGSDFCVRHKVCIDYARREMRMEG